MEINFINRISLYPTITTIVNYFNKEVRVNVLRKEELYGMKIAALIDRSKPRDLFDIAYLIDNLKDVDMCILAKAAIFYLSLDGIYTIDNSICDGIKSITYQAVKKELLPVLKKGERFDVVIVKEKVIKNVCSLLTKNQDNLSYLKEFSEGNFNPYILFDSKLLIEQQNIPWLNGKFQILNNYPN